MEFVLSCLVGIFFAAAIYLMLSRHSVRIMLGIAILGTVLFTSTASILTSNLEDQGMASDQADQIVTAVVQSAGGAIAQLEQSPATSAAADTAKTAFSDGTRYAAFTAAGFLAIGLVATLALPSRRPEEATESDHSENAPKTATD